MDDYHLENILLENLEQFVDHGRRVARSIYQSTSLVSRVAKLVPIDIEAAQRAQERLIEQGAIVVVYRGSQKRGGKLRLPHQRYRIER